MAEMMKGNEAIAEAAVRAGVKFYAGYPITPSSEIMEYLSWRLPVSYTHLTLPTNSRV